MELEIYLCFLLFIPPIVWFAACNTSQILRSTITGVSFGLVVTHASAGLHALHLAWPVSEAFGQLAFYSSYIHVKAGVYVSIFLHLIPGHTPITDDQKLFTGNSKLRFMGHCLRRSGFSVGLFYKQMEQKTKKSSSLDSGHRGREVSLTLPTSSSKLRTSEIGSRKCEY